MKKLLTGALAGGAATPALASDTEYECHAGAMVAGVALKGSYAKVAD